jgi:hypothetical protein
LIAYLSADNGRGVRRARSRQPAAEVQACRMTDRDQEEQDLRIDQMTINIEKMRSDMANDNKRFVVQALGAAAACVAAGAGLATLILHLTGKL